jgi:uncharacterized membrane protein YhhN
MTFLLSIVAFLSALIYGGMCCRKQMSAWRSTFKFLSVGLLAAVAALSQAPILLVVALGFSSLGDILLAQENDRGFLSGMAAFFSAHIAYAILFSNLAEAEGMNSFQIPAGLALILLAAGVYRYLWIGLGVFRLPVGLYSVAIAAMGVTAVGLPWIGVFGLITVGVGAFMASDIMLAIEKFRLPDQSKARKYLPYLIWAFYWFGQMFILLGVVSST